MIGKRKWLAKNKRPKNENRSQKANRKTQIEAGFTLLELMIAMFILIILLSVALPTYQKSVQQAREAVLQQNLDTMRRSIDQYGADKGKLPQSLDDLVTGGYLREKPIDPIIEKAEWKEIQGEDTNSPDGEQGLKDVKSTAEGEDSDGKKYEDY
ncbi:MAG: type II secretion system GspH family protein [Acidobacteria bacterium]|nr:type II secretion system GspH family protein [Acidobacteriota bacterium]MCA1637186.1 type II secretion system GspH family protein [Acidobacteriota bacterium]